MNLPWRARAVVSAAVLVGAAALASAIVQLPSTAPSMLQVVVACVIGALMVASWVWPLMIFVDRHSKTVHFDEYCFVALVVLVPPSIALVTFFATTVLAQLVRRRALVKSAFNVGQVLGAAGAGILALRLVAPAGTVLRHAGQAGAVGGLTLGRVLLGAAAGGVVYAVVNIVSVASVLVATGVPWRNALGKDLDSRVKFLSGSIVIALTTAVLVADAPWLLALAVAPPLILRVVLAEQFEASRDRARVRGLFEATLHANRSMGEDDVTAALVSSAQMLLRGSDAWLSEHPEGDDALHAPVAVLDNQLWLNVDGRDRAEPFDSSDQALLDALAAVGTGAMSNATLYEEGRSQRERLSAITSSMGEGVCALTPAGDVTFLNPAACTMLGWDVAAHSLEGGVLLPAAGSRLIGLRAPSFLLAPARHAMTSKSMVTSYDTRFERTDGSYFHVAFTASPIMGGAEATGVVLVFRDITERKEFEEQLARHAFHDALTGLPNRRLFLDHLDHAMRRSTRSSERHAVLFVDVDRFKMINDSLGHSAGDHLLVAIADRMQGCLRPGDMLARFGGDEFTLLIEQVEGAEDAAVVARRILSQMRQPVRLPDGHEVVATLSIGIALTVPGKTRDDLLHDADVAMYQIKSKGRGGQYEVFDADAMGVRSAERIELETALRRALDEDELEVFYQPLFSMSDCKIVGAEALVRWNHPERGLLGPENFIGMAEDTGLILPLGRQVLERACAQIRDWNKKHGTELVVGVNLSARQFQQADLVQDVAEVLLSSGVKPHQLSLEITESLAMDDVGRTRETLVQLKALGVRVAIDDFGTGHSALGYLARFPVDVVKIDRSFIEDVEIDPVKSAIVSAVITLSDAIGTTTVVEGVETREQFDHLRQLGCLEVQGFYMARPMPAEQLGELLRLTSGAKNPRRPLVALAGVATG